VEVPLEQQDWRGYQLLEQQQLKAYFNAAQFHPSHPNASALFQMDEDIYQFLWTHHHILMDGWCGPLVIKEFFLLPSVQQRSRFTTGTNLFLQKLHSLAEKQDLSQLEAFWRKTLQGLNQPHWG